MSNEQKTILDYETVELDDAGNAVVIIDQTKLPGTIEIISLKTLNSHFRGLISDYTSKALYLLSLAYKCLEILFGNLINSNLF